MSYTAPVTDRMQRARTPFGAVPISTIYGYDYPLADKTSLSTNASKKEVHYSTDLSESVNHLVRTSRAFSECRMDPVYHGVSAAGISFLPHALQEARSRSQSPFELRATTPLRVAATIPTVSKYFPEHGDSVEQQRSTTIAYGGNTPWSSTGFYYTPRYPQSYRGTASTSVPFSRRYPARRFIPSYVPVRYTRKFY